MTSAVFLALALVAGVLAPRPATAVTLAECQAFLCMPGGFPPPECSPARAAVLRRIRALLPALPAWSECVAAFGWDPANLTHNEDQLIDCPRGGYLSGRTCSYTTGDGCTYSYPARIRARAQVVVDGATSFSPNHTFTAVARPDGAPYLSSGDPLICSPGEGDGGGYDDGVVGPPDDEDDCVPGTPGCPPDEEDDCTPGTPGCPPDDDEDCVPGTPGCPGDECVPGTPGCPGDECVPGTPGCPADECVPGTPGCPPDDDEDCVPGTPGCPGDECVPGTPGCPGDECVPGTPGCPADECVPGTPGCDPGDPDDCTPGTPGCDPGDPDDCTPGTPGCLSPCQDPDRRPSPPVPGTPARPEGDAYTQPIESGDTCICPGNYPFPFFGFRGWICLPNPGSPVN